MRILFGFTGGRGHVEPLLPLALAARTAGHAVAFAGRPSILPVVEELGFPAFPAEEPKSPPKRIPLQAPDPEREERNFRDGFATWHARERATRVPAVCAEWRAELVVCEEADFGSMIAAERLGLPYASLLVLAAGFARRDYVAEALNAVRAEHDLPPDPDLKMLRRYLVLAPFPPSFRDPAFPLPSTALCVRQAAPLDADGPPPWLVRHAGAPTVYVTLGTVFNLESGDLFSRVFEGLSDLLVNVVATVGPYIDPSEFDPLPDNIHVEQHIPQSSVFPHCDVVVSHGGSGSVLGALAHGLPQVLIPIGADQPRNASRCDALGLARVLDAIEATPEDMRDAVSAVLTGPSYRSAAEWMRDEFATLPGPEHAVTLLEHLVATH